MSTTARSPLEQIRDTIESGEKLVVVDLFCGAGGLSWGLAKALERIAADYDRSIGDLVELHAVNHWDVALETHKRNHPWAEHYNCPIQELNPTDVVELGRTVTLLIAAPDCTHFSPARGGGPKNRDKRMTPREVLDWVERLSVQNLLFENVPAFRDWGPLDENNRPIPEQKGEYFENWLNALSIEGFAVEHRILNAADYGDATSRRRLFVAGRKHSGVDWPEQTHSENSTVDGTDSWRTAADIIDWSDPGESLWIRDLEDGRRSPLVNNTMQRIAEGIRRHCDDTLEPFADVIAQVGREDEDDPVPYPLPELRERIIPVQYADLVSQVVDQPFLVHYPGVAQTVTLCTPAMRPSTFLLRQHNGDGAHPLNVHESPVPTVASAGAISRVDTEPFVLPKNGIQRGLFSNPAYDPTDRPLHTVIASDTRQGYVVNPYLVPFYNEREGQRPRVHSLDDPHPTIPATKVPAGVCQPYLVEYYGKGQPQPLWNPVPTIPTKDRFALVIPELWPLGLDIKFRMLKPEELAAAQGFPPEYEFVGNKTETVKQIGNAVPVNLAAALCEQMLVGSQPTIDSYTGGATGGVEADD